MRNIGLKMISLARKRDANVFTGRLYAANLHRKKLFTLNMKLPMPKYYILTLWPKPQGIAPWDLSH